MEAERHGTLTEAAVAVAEVPCCKRKGQVKKKKKKKQYTAFQIFKIPPRLSQKLNKNE